MILTKQRNTRAAAVILGSLLVSLLASMPAQAAAVPFGQVYTQFSLASPGLGAGAGNGFGYFHTDAGIEVRDQEGTLVDTYLNPAGRNIFGVTHDGTDLYVSDMNNSIIFQHFGGNSWNLVTLVAETGTRGLTRIGDDFYMIVDDGTNIAKIDSSGITTAKYTTGSLDAWGLAGNANDNVLYVTTFDDTFTPFYLNTLTFGNAVTLTGLGSTGTVGLGYDNSQNYIAFNNSTVTGSYAGGPVTAVPLPPAAGLFAAALAGLAAFSRKGRMSQPTALH